LLALANKRDKKPAITAAVTAATNFTYDLSGPISHQAVVSSSRLYLARV